MNGKTNGTLLLGLIVFAIVVLYITGRYYLRREGFDDSAEDAKARRMATLSAPSVYDTNSVRTDFLPQPAYATNEEPILKLDDYEYSMIFQNEGSREVGKREISDAMSRYPLDWSNKPPSDQEFQVAQTAFTEAVSKETPANTSRFDDISGKQMQPPNLSAADQAEREIVQMYKPEDTKDLIHYSLKDAKRLVERLYERRGKKATIEPSQQGNNVFEIVEVDDIHPKIVWEDEVERDAPSDKMRDSLRGEQTIVVPTVVNDLAAGLDPWYEPRQSARMGRHDYTKWTPGLERQFAPTYEHRSWF
jgi:hypothetical protein